MCYLTLCFNPFSTSFDAPVPILTHLGASFDSEMFVIVLFFSKENESKFRKIDS